MSVSGVTPPVGGGSVLDTATPVWDGVLNVCKPSGWTSHDVVASIRKQLGIKKVGHGGTLDPAATGVLPILLGKATRISEFLMDWDKEYAAVLRLGKSTDTQDATGNIIEQMSVREIPEQSILDAVNQFHGEIEQIPPMYSAVKVAGRPLYKAARAGQSVERFPRQVTIYAIDIERIAGLDVSLRVRCSKGTYIRTLCSDIGNRLGVGGHLLSLSRVRVGPLDIARSVEPSQCTAAYGRDGDDSAFISMDRALSDWPVVMVEEQAVFRVLHGASVSFSGIVSPQETVFSQWGGRCLLRVQDQRGTLLGVGRLVEGATTGAGEPGALSMVKVLADESSLPENASPRRTNTTRLAY